LLLYFLCSQKVIIGNVFIRYYRVLTMVYNTQRYWVFGLWTKSENPISLNVFIVMYLASHRPVFQEPEN
jgi:hypothetical protein